MPLGALVIALTLTPGSVWPSTELVAEKFRSSQSAWRVTTSQHFEIHYLPALAQELDRVVQAAEHAYTHVSRRLNFVLSSKVPLVLFAPSRSPSREQVVAYAISNAVAPPVPHRSRIVLPLPEVDGQLDALTLHELTHLLVAEIITPGAGGDGGVPRWVHDMASYMVGTWSDDQDRLMRDLVASGNLPALSQLTGGGGFANPSLNDALGHAAFDYIESRWGPARIRRFLNALAVPREPNTYEAVFDQTPAEFDAGFRQYMEHRFRPIIR